MAIAENGLLNHHFFRRGQRNIGVIPRHAVNVPLQPGQKHHVVVIVSRHMLLVGLCEGVGLVQWPLDPTGLGKLTGLHPHRKPVFKLNAAGQHLKL